MSDKMESTPLTKLATKSGLVSRPDQLDRDAKSRSLAAQRSGGFNGFMKTFLGRDEKNGASISARKGSNSKFTQKNTNQKQAADKLSKQERKALREAMDKTVDDEGLVDPQVAAAAAEAAMLLMGLFFDGGDGFGMVKMPDDALAQLTEALAELNPDAAKGGLAGLEGLLLDPEALSDDALATTNASAEMNSAAVLSALEELLDGMPRQALEQAMADAAAKMDVSMDDGDWLNRIAAALEMEVVDVNPGVDADAISLLQQLAATAELQNQSAESSGLAGDGEILEWFKQFLQEKSGEKAVEGPINLEGSSELDGELFEEFTAWLLTEGKVANRQDAKGEGNALLKMLAESVSREAANPDNPNSEKIYSWLEKNLDSALHNTSTVAGEKAFNPNLSSMPSLVDGVSGQPGQAGGGQDGALLSGQPTVGFSAAAGNAGVTAPNPVPMSSLLTQMENIERLTEAMKMANRGTVKNLTVQLSPPELGKVSLRVESREGVVSAYLRVEKPEAAAQLGQNLQQLRESLRTQGIELGELDIRQHNFSQTAGDGEGGRRNRETDDDAGGGSRRVDSLDDIEEAGQAEPETIRPPGSRGGLNMVV